MVCSTCRRTPLLCGCALESPGVIHRMALSCVRRSVFPGAFNFPMGVSPHPGRNSVGRLHSLAGFSRGFPPRFFPQVGFLVPSDGCVFAD